MKAIIYRPSKSSMQSGLCATKKWLLRTENRNKYIEPFFGWTGSNDMEQEVVLKFATKEEAENFAKSKNWEYEIIEPKERKIVPKSYVDNFK